MYKELETVELKQEISKNIEKEIVILAIGIRNNWEILGLNDSKR